MSPASIVIAAGVAAALHVGKLAPAIATLHQALGLSLVQAGFLLSMVQLAGMSLGVAFGVLADGLGGRRSMVLGLALLALASAAGGLASGVGGLLVLREDESIAFAYLDPAGGWRDFMASAQASIAAARDPRSSFDPRLDDPALIHMTTLPWVHFTSFSHARNWGREDSVPKLAFGRLAADGERLWMPLSVEVHHGLMDGLHVGRYIEAFVAAAAAPADWLGET